MKTPGLIAGRFSFRTSVILRPMTAATGGLTPEQRETYETRGLVRLRGAISRAAAEAMAERLWAELERKFGLRRRHPSTWTTERPSGLQAIQKSGAFRAMASPAVAAALDDIIGRNRWARPDHWGQPLVCLPTQHRWAVPHKSWHLDLAADPRRSAPQVGRVFAILAPLAPRGGGALVATGSHRLVQDLADEADAQQSSAQMRKRLQAAHRWFADLMRPDPDRNRTARYMDAPTEVRGVPMRVEEMTGEPGDVWLMHPAALHAPAPNALAAPRLVLAQYVMPKATAALATY
jgi:hypothetical protein